jgi:uncharacterized protein
MYSIKNLLIAGAENKPVLLDVFCTEKNLPLPVIIYAHGFNGFKDWGNADIFAKQFAEAGFLFVKFNFSHNGTTPQQPGDFVDLHTFGNNNYSKQLYDLNAVINWVCDAKNEYKNHVDVNHIYLIGHSMGGGIATLQSARDKRIKKLITWAGISECKTPWGNWSKEKMQEWKHSGVQYYSNSRTNQQMPLFYQLYYDYMQNKDALNIKKAISSLRIPVLICHGTNDTSVHVEKAYDLLQWQPAAQLFTVESDHVFGRKHPWLLNDLPSAMEEIVKKSILFLKE